MVSFLVVDAQMSNDDVWFVKCVVEFEHALFITIELAKNAAPSISDDRPPQSFINRGIPPLIVMNNTGDKEFSWT